MTSTYAFRVLLIGGFALTLVTAISPATLASDGTGSQSSGKFIDGATHALAQSRLSKDGGSSNAIVAAITAYQAARDKAVTAFQTASRSAQDAYQAAISPVALARKTALESANTSMLIALENATTDNAKANAKAALQAAIKAANDSLLKTNESARSAFKAAIKSAEQSLKSSLESANATLHQAVFAARTPHPAISTSPSFRPSQAAK